MLVKCQMCQGAGIFPCECSLKRDDADIRERQGADCCQEFSSEAVSSYEGEPSLASTIEEAEVEMPDAKNETPCSICGGSGMVQCLGCLGTGYVDMPCFA